MSLILEEWTREQLEFVGRRNWVVKRKSEKRVQKGAGG